MKTQIPLSLPNELIVDNFAGGGGASTGIEQAFGRPVDIAINHDREAIAMHNQNHPHTRHYREDVWKVDPVAVTGGQPIGLAWFSPDCKHFSKAKGGKPVEKKIRGLAWVVIKWAALTKPRVIMLENVEEFQGWGPLQQDGRPCPLRKGLTFRRWKKQLEKLGYKVESKELRACDYGAPTIRKRLFIIARRDGLPIVWPGPTHGPGKLPYLTAADCIDWSLPCPSIFERKRQLAEATMRRIAKGIKRFVIDAEEPFIVTCNHGKDGFRGQGINEPFKTVTGARDAHGVVVPYLTEHANASSQRVFDPVEPLRTQCAQVKGGHFALVSPFLTKFRAGNSGADIAAPMPTVTANSFIKRPGGCAPIGLAVPYLVPRYGERPGQEPRTHAIYKPIPTITPDANCGRLVMPLIVKNNFGEKPYHGADEPLHTITTQGNKHALVAAFMAQHNAGFYEGAGRSASAPMSTIMQSASHQSAVAASLIKFRGTCQHGQDVRAPMATITGQGNHIAAVYAFLMKFYGEGGQWADPRDPMHTIPTKDRMALVTIKGEEYVIADIGMRMLEPRELYRAQGFPDSYVIETGVDPDTGETIKFSKSSRVRMCGNSVCPPIARALVEANFRHEQAFVVPRESTASCA